MAKGARKKTKWVSLSLGSASTTAAVPPGQTATAAESSKSVWGNKVKALHQNSSDSENDAFPRSYQDSSQRHEAALQPNGQHNEHHQRGYSSSHTRSHYNSNSYRHSTSFRRPYYSTFRNTASTSDVRNEQNSTVTVNEDEYTKISTPRQDVLFKKGYLSRPRTNATLALTGTDTGPTTGTTTDGSEGATGSGSVSTAESITSDSTYLTDGLFMELPTPYPYYGYFDQTGVLVMNGFAVDNNGYSYMNGGQTYIYPPNYGFQPSCEEENPTVVLEAAESPETTGLEKVSRDGDSDSLNINNPTALASVSTQPEKVLDRIDESEQHELIEGEDQSEQQIPYSPYCNGYDYAQFYNTFYYPGCMITPFQVVENGTYYEPLDVQTNDEQSKDGRRPKHCYRSWDGNYHDPNYMYPNIEEETNASNEVPVTDPAVEQIVETSSIVTTTASNSVQSLHSPHPPKHQPEELSSQKRLSKSSSDQNNVARSHSNSTKQQKNPSLKTHKKDLIQSTLAFAEQNIDLSKPAYRLKSSGARSDQANTWRVVCNGKEMTVEEDSESRHVDTKTIVSMEAIKELPEVTPSGNAPLILGAAKEHDCKTGKKDTHSKKGKKTAKGKGKKPKRLNLLQQHKGFELIEPEFNEAVKNVALHENVSEEEVEEEDEGLETNLGDTSFESDLKNNLIPDMVEAENCPKVAEEDLEELLYNVQITDLGMSFEHEKLDGFVTESTIVENQHANEHEDDTPTSEHNEKSNDNQQGVYSMVEHCKASDTDSSVMTTHLNTDCQDSPIEACEPAGCETSIVAPECSPEACDSSTMVCESSTVVCESSTELCEFSTTVSESSTAASAAPTTTCESSTELCEFSTVECEPLAIPCESSIVVCESSTEVRESSTAGSESLVVAHESSTLVCGSPFSSLYDDGEKDDEGESRHFSGEEYSENFDSGLQSPATFIAPISEEKDCSSLLGSYSGSGLHVTDAVTKWLSETLCNIKPEEMFVLPESPELLDRIVQFKISTLEDYLGLSSDTFSSSSDGEAEDADSDYMSDVQVKNRLGSDAPDPQQKTESQKDQLAKQTANGYHHAGENHSNPKQKRCIIM